MTDFVPNTTQDPQPTPPAGDFAAGGGQQQEPNTDPSILDKLQKRLQDKDEFIETLKAERREDRARFQKYDEILTEMAAQLSTIENSKQILDTLKSKGEQPPVEKPAVIDPEVLKSLGVVTREELERERQEAAFQSNFQEVISVATKVFGDKVNDVIKEKADSLGYTIDEARALAGTKPQAFIKLFIGDRPQNSGKETFNKGSVNTYGMQGVQDKPKFNINMSLDERIAYINQRLQEYKP